jgi:hypothetical protein
MAGTCGPGFAKSELRDHHFAAAAAILSSRNDFLILERILFRRLHVCRLHRSLREYQRVLAWRLRRFHVKFLNSIPWKISMDVAESASQAARRHHRIVTLRRISSD